MSDKMKLIMESWRQLQEAAPTSAHHIVRRMKDTGDDALTALMHLIPELPREEASNWLKRNTQDINRAKRELGLTDNDRLKVKMSEEVDVSLQEIIDEEIEAYVKENAMGGGGVAFAPGKKNEEKLEEMPIWPQGSPHAGLEVHPSTMDSYRAYMKKHPKAKPPVKDKTTKSGRKLSIGSGAPFKRGPETYDDVSHLIDEEQLNEEGADCIRDYMAMGHSYSEALRICRRWYGDDEVSNEPSGIKVRLQEKQDDLEEGILKNLAMLVGLMAGGQAAALDIDLGGGEVAGIGEIAQALRTDGSEKSNAVAGELAQMLKSKPVDTNGDGALQVDGTEYNLAGVDIQHIKSVLNAGGEAGPDASAKPDISGMEAPEARKVLYDYYRSIGTPGGMTTMRVNKDLRDAGIGQPSADQVNQMQQDQATMAGKLKKSSIKEQG